MTPGAVFPWHCPLIRDAINSFLKVPLNESISAGNSKTITEVDEVFLRKIQPVSKQLQDCECHRVIKGVTACTALSFRSDDPRLYEAVVEEARSCSFKPGIYHKQVTTTSHQGPIMCS